MRPQIISSFTAAREARLGELRKIPLAPRLLRPLGAQAEREGQQQKFVSAVEHRAFSGAGRAEQRLADIFAFRRIDAASGAAVRAPVAA